MGLETRIQGALKHVGHRAGRSMIARILQAHGLPPVRERLTSWQTFLRAHWGAIAGAGFFTTDVWTVPRAGRSRRSPQGQGGRRARALDVRESFVLPVVHPPRLASSPARDQLPISTRTASLCRWQPAAITTF